VRSMRRAAGLERGVCVVLARPMLVDRCMKTRLAAILASLVVAGGGGLAIAEVAPIGPDFVAAAPRLHIDPSLVASEAMNRIAPLDVVAFRKNSAQLDDVSAAQIDAAGKWLKRHKDYRIVLEGHADRVGSDVY